MEISKKQQRKPKQCRQQQHIGDTFNKLQNCQSVEKVYQLYHTKYVRVKVEYTTKKNLHTLRHIKNGYWLQFKASLPATYYSKSGETDTSIVQKSLN